MTVDRERLVHEALLAQVRPFDRLWANEQYSARASLGPPY